jgi:hypothetical protein
MPSWVAPPPLELQLWYSDMLVADLHQVFPHQGTWFASYELKIAPGEGALQDRLLEYVAFAEDFNRRIAQGQDHDFAEFDGFGAVVGPERATTGAAVEPSREVGPTSRRRLARHI